MLIPVAPDVHAALVHAGVEPSPALGAPLLRDAQVVVNLMHVEEIVALARSANKRVLARLVPAVQPHGSAALLALGVLQNVTREPVRLCPLLVLGGGAHPWAERLLAFLRRARIQPRKGPDHVYRMPARDADGHMQGGSRPKPILGRRFVARGRHVVPAHGSVHHRQREHRVLGLPRVGLPVFRQLTRIEALDQHLDASGASFAQGSGNLLARWLLELPVGD